jgi:hypothetical protein
VNVASLLLLLKKISVMDVSPARETDVADAFAQCVETKIMEKKAVLLRPKQFSGLINTQRSAPTAQIESRRMAAVITWHAARLVDVGLSFGGLVAVLTEVSITAADGKRSQCDQLHQSPKSFNTSGPSLYTNFNLLQYSDQNQ